MPSGPIGYKCPIGIRQSLSDGGWIRWAGYDPADGETCAGRNAKGNVVRRVRGIWALWDTDRESWPEVRRAMAELTSEQPGFVAVFDARTSTAGSTGTDSRIFHFKAYVTGEAFIMTPAGRFHTTIIQVDYDGGIDNSAPFGLRFWRDKDSGIVVQGQTYDRKWGIREWTTTEFAKAP
jgi:hypothetical protein